MDGQTDDRMDGQVSKGQTGDMMDRHDKTDDGWMNVC